MSNKAAENHSAALLLLEIKILPKERRVYTEHTEKNNSFVFLEER
jgi:hypothetical protein